MMSDNDDYSDGENKKKDTFLDLTQDDSDDSSVLEISCKKPAAKAPKRECKFDGFSDSDDSSLDGDLLQGPVFTKQHTMTKKKKAPCTTSAAEAKQAKKAAAQLKRQQEKEEREAKKLAEKETKKRRIEQAQQTMGKFSHMEIVVLVEPRILNECSEMIEPLKEKYLVQQHDCGMGGHAIQWIRKDYLAGGANDAMEALGQGNRYGYQHLDRLVVVFDDPKRFLKLLERESIDNDDYPALESWLTSLQSAWQTSAACKQQQPQIVLLLHQVTDQVNREWNAHRRRPKTPPPPSDAELHDAITWLLILFQVECIHCSSLEHVSETLQKMTRALCERPYMQQATELECIKKIKATAGDKDDSAAKAKDCWIRQLQQVPRVSETKALNLASEYPTARSLWEAYQDESKTEEEKRLLVSNFLTEGRQQPKLSDSIYRLMTSTDPKQLL